MQTTPTNQHSRPRAYNPSGLRQGLRALAGSDYLNMRRVFVLYTQPIRRSAASGDENDKSGSWYSLGEPC